MIKSAYLAGPMRGYPRYNFDAFDAAMLDLEGRGIKIQSPHVGDLKLGFDPSKTMEEQNFDIEDCVRRDVESIISTDAVCFLPGWENSHGARAEFAVAKWLERPCYLYPELKPIECKLAIS